MTSLRARWDAGLSARESYVQRAREAASVSLPFLAPRSEGEIASGDDFPQRYSGRAARGVTTLASKMTLGLFPPTAPFFKLDPDLRVFLELGGTEDSIDDLVLDLSRRERAAQAFLDGNGFRAESFLAFEELLLTGNYLLEQDPDGSFEGYRLDEFQIDRDGRDRVTSILIREVVSRAELPEEVAAVSEPARGVPEEEGLVELYTLAERIPQPRSSRRAPRWLVVQEAGGVLLGKERKVSDADLPWIPVRLFKTRGEAYGRSLFDLIQGEVEVVEGLTQAIVEDASMAARGVWVVDPASGIDLTDFLRQESGGAIYGKRDGVGMARTEKGADLSIAANLLAERDRELAQTFLAFLPRHAERVTAEEIARLSQELNEAFGGAFALLASELQRPVAEKTMRRMEKLGEIQPLPDEKLARVKIVTGMDALGRGRDSIALQRLVAFSQQALGPEETSRRLNPENLLTRIAAAEGVDPEGLVLSNEQVAQAEAQRQQTEFFQRIGPQGVRALESLIQQRQQQQQE